MPALDANTALMSLQALSGQASFAATVLPLKCRLTVSAPAALVPGVELSGPGYTAGGLAVTFGNFATTSTGAICFNTNAFSWTNTGSAPWVIAGADFYDSSGTPVRKCFGLWDGQPVTIGPGSPFSVAALSIGWAFP